MGEGDRRGHGVTRGSPWCWDGVSIDLLHNYGYAGADTCENELRWTLKTYVCHGMEVTPQFENTGVNFQKQNQP